MDVRFIGDISYKYDERHCILAPDAFDFMDNT